MLPGRLSCPSVRVSFTPDPSQSTAADTVVVGLLAGEGLPDGAPDGLSELIASGEVKASFKSLALSHLDGKRWLLVGLGEREKLSGERVRVAAALAQGRAKELSARTLCWQAPLGQDGLSSAEAVGAIVEGTLLADYVFDRYRSSSKADGQSAEQDQDGPDGGDSQRLRELIVSSPGDHGRHVFEAAIVTEAVNAARDLQNSPGNVLTPTALGQEAQRLADEIEGLSAEVEGREGIIARSMGAFAAVAQGSAQEPRLITLRYEPPADALRDAATAAGGRPPVLGIVGKAVTFDSGGISLKPGAKMSEMKFDMSGGAAALLGIAAIARLRLPISVIAVIGATENLPSGTAVKPGDIVAAANGRTIEINNTDAEGRLVLADCLCHAVSLGAERIVDLATLTGAVLIALGSTHAGLISNDDDLAERVAAAGRRTGEIVWRLPMHEEYDELLKGAYADLDNAPEGRKAGTIVGGTFLSNFVGDTPWAHLDIAGSAWDLGRAYAPKQGAGYGVRLLVELARSYCS